MRHRGRAWFWLDQTTSWRVSPLCPVGLESPRGRLGRSRANPTCSRSFPSRRRGWRCREAAIRELKIEKIPRSFTFPYPSSESIWKADVDRGSVLITASEIFGHWFSRCGKNREREDLRRIENPCDPQLDSQIFARNHIPSRVQLSGIPRVSGNEYRGRSEQNIARVRTKNSIHRLVYEDSAISGDEKWFSLFFFFFYFLSSGEIDCVKRACDAAQFNVVDGLCQLER